MKDPYMMDSKTHAENLASYQEKIGKLANMAQEATAIRPDSSETITLLNIIRDLQTTMGILAYALTDMNKNLVLHLGAPGTTCQPPVWDFDGQKDIDRIFGYGEGVRKGA